MPETGRIPMSVRDNEDDRGLFKEPSRTGPALGFLDLPPEIRILIYRFALGYRTIHVRQVHRRRWRYTICKCPHDERSDSEYTMGRIWAGDRMGWRHARPLCDFDDTKHSDDRARSPSFVDGGNNNNNNRNTRNNQQWPGEEKLHLSLLQTCKTVYSEASAIPYSDNIYTFVLARALEGFLEQRHCGLSLVQLAHIRNVSIFVQPKGYMMEEWNLLLGDEPSCLDVLTGLRRLQLVVGPQSRIIHLRLPLGHWMELRLVYGLLVFGKLGIPEISVDVGLCDRDGEDDEERVQGYAEMLEGALRGHWERVEKELKQLRSSYLKMLGSS